MKVCYKKRRTAAAIANQYTTLPTDLPHKNIAVCLPRLCDSEESFVRWFTVICDHLANTCTARLVNLQFVKATQDDAEYIRTLQHKNLNCRRLQQLNLEVNQQLLSSIDEHLSEQLGLQMENLCYLNLELVKHHFQQRITVFYLMEFERDLTFSDQDVVRFLQKIDLLSRYYTILFDEPPGNDIVTNWIVSALAKSPENHETLLQVQQNWEKIMKDPAVIRTILFRQHHD